MWPQPIRLGGCEVIQGRKFCMCLPQDSAFLLRAAVSKALEQLDTANRDAAAAKQQAEQVEQELLRTQQQAQSAEALVQR